MCSQMLIVVVGWSLLGQVQQAPAPNQSASENVETRYAQAQLELAEANLSRVEQSNKRLAGSVPGSIVAEYQHDVDVAKTRLDLAQAGRSGGEFQAWIERADAERSAAETAWKNATAVNDRVPGTFAAVDIERYRLRAEVAQLQLERGRVLADSGRDAQMQWEIDLLDNQVQRLKEEARRTGPYVDFYQSWRW